MKGWFTAAELAGLRGMRATARGVHMLADEAGWDRRQRDHGKGWEYSVSSLPEETRVALLLREARAAAGEAKRTPAAGDGDSAELWAWYERLPGSMQAEAQRRFAALHALQALVDEGVKVVTATAQIAAQYEVSAATLYRWRDQVKGAHLGDWLPKLAPGWTGRTKKAELDDRAWDFFRTLYLTPEQRSVPHCYQLMKDAAEAHGWAVPSLRTIQRRASAIDPLVLKREREGEAALLQEMRPAMQRTVGHLHAMQWLSGDGYKHNLMVKLPSGVEGRPHTWFWQDVRTRKIVGFQPDESENGDQIRRALGRVIEQYGIPEHVTIDNTRAAANKGTTGRVSHRHRFTARADEAIGVLPQLGIQVHWTSIVAGKGHGQAKPVERAFGVGGLGEYVDKHPKAAGAYTGPNTTAKPANYGSRVLEWSEFLEVLEDGVRRWNAIEGRRSEVCEGRLSFDQAFAESYERNAHRVRKPTASQRRLWLLAAEEARVQKDGSLMLRAGTGPGGRNRYGDECLFRHIGHRVVVRFDPDALHTDVHVYELGGRYIGAAACIHSAGYDELEGGKRFDREIRRLRKNAREKAEIEKRMSLDEALDLLPDAPATEEPETNVVRPAFTGGQQPEEEDFDAEAAFSEVMARVRRAHFGDGAA